jgi:hypothetical protein
MEISDAMVSGLKLTELEPPDVAAAADVVAPDEAADVDCAVESDG